MSNTYPENSSTRGFIPPSIIQSLWIGKELSLMEKLSISSFLSNGHSFHLYMYDDVAGLPKGTVAKDAAEILGPEKIFKYKNHDSYAGFANLFRYKLLLEKGGFWVDTDVVCLKPFQFKHDHVFTSEYSFELKANKIANCIIKAAVGSSIMQYCYNVASKCNPDELVWGETGPTLVTKAVKKFNMEKFVVKPTAFCPIPPRLWRLLIEAPVPQKLQEIISSSDCYAIHLWNEMWRRGGIDKNAEFPPRSLYEILKQKYLTF